MSGALPSSLSEGTDSRGRDPSHPYVHTLTHTHTHTRSYSHKDKDTQTQTKKMRHGWMSSHTAKTHTDVENKLGIRSSRCENIRAGMVSEDRCLPVDLMSNRPKWPKMHGWQRLVLSPLLQLESWSNKQRHPRTPTWGSGK